MEMTVTNGSDPRFAALCSALDDYLNELVGGEVQRREYNQYNTPTQVTDVILLLDGGQAVACAGFKRYGEGTAEIKRVFTRPAYRGQGCAGKVMAALEQRAAEQGYSRLILETGRMMAPAVALYESLGYRRIENYGQYRCMEQAVCMAKTLRPQVREDG
jgi:GNAT superfamily N-acetyltransferase